MADIVNVRDLTIQAQLPRLLPIFMPGNVTVPTTNVQGLPDYYTATKQVVLRASTQVFRNTTVGGTSPSNIVVTADVRNILGTVAWEVVEGTVNYTTGVNTLTIQAGGLTTPIARIKATVISDGVTYYDIISIVNVGQASGNIQGFLTNEMASVPSMENGVVLSYYNSGGQFRVFSSDVEVTGTAVTYSVVSTSAVNIRIDNTGTFTVDNLTLDEGSGILQASYNGRTIQRTFAIRKVSQITNGKDGSNGVRGTVNIAVSTTGNTWSDALAVAGLVSAGYGAPQSRDIVTLYNTSSNYSQSKFYDGSNWLTLDAYINGNLLVNGSVFAEKVDTRNLTIKDASGNIILGANTKLDGKTYIKDASIGNAQIETLAVKLANIDTATINRLSAFSANLGTITAGRAQNEDNSSYINFNATDGAPFLSAGNGAVKINADGSGVFARTILSAPNLVAQSPTNGTSISVGSVGFVGGEYVPFTVYIDTGITYQESWYSAPSDVFIGSATISGGSSSNGGSYGFGATTVVIGDGLAPNNGAGLYPVEARIYLRFTWTPVAGSGSIVPNKIDWKLVKV